MCLKITKKLLIGFFILNIMWLITMLVQIDAFARATDDVFLISSIKSCIFSGLWIWYLLVSKRVKKTFVN